MDLSIICVNWNSLRYLRECLASVYTHTRGISFEIIVVDNASPEGGVDSLLQQFPNISIIKSSENLGFSRANNLGFRYASGKYLLFLNPDTQLANPAINIMLAALESLVDVGIVGCTLLNSDLSIQTESIQRFPTILNQVFDLEYFRLKWPHCRLWEIAPLFEDNVAPVKVEVIPGACMLTKRGVFEQVGFFSEDYFMYAEDIDLNHKMKRAGFTSYYVGQAKIIHHGGKSSTQQRVSQWATVMKFRAMVKFYQKTRGQLYAALYRAAIGCAALGRLVVLGLMIPFGGTVWRRAQIQGASAKWGTVLKCTLGLAG
jgi:hypothetical protein